MMYTTENIEYRNRWMSFCHAVNNVKGLNHEGLSTEIFTHGHYLPVVTHQFTPLERDVSQWLTRAQQ